MFYHIWAAISYSGAKPFEQIINIPPTENPIKKMGQAVSEKKTLKDFMILYLYVAKGYPRGRDGDKILILTKTFYYFSHTW